MGRILIQPRVFSENKDLGHRGILVKLVASGLDLVVAHGGAVGLAEFVAKLFEELLQTRRFAELLDVLSGDGPTIIGYQEYVAAKLEF